MRSDDQQAQIAWRDGVPIASAFDDPYFSLADGLAETRHVFLQGNDLPARFRDGFQIAELGFGTGLNMLATAQAWRAAGVAGQLHLTSFEAFPMDADSMEKALSAFPDLAPDAAPLVGQWAAGAQRITLGDGVHLQVILGDARDTLPAWQGKADAWFLDGFSPARNPQLWTPALMQAVADHTVPGGSFATYSAAGHVRRALAEAGFAVARMPGYGSKRHMSVGRLERP